MFRVPVEKHGINSHIRQKGKIAELALGYGGSVGALKAMGALEMGLSEEELKPLVTAWRAANTNITQFWWDVDKAVIEAVGQKAIRKTHGLTFQCTHGMLFITLPSGRRLAYAMQNLKHQEIVMHIHDEIVIEAPTSLSVEEICEQMSQAPSVLPRAKLSHP